MFLVYGGCRSQSGFVYVMNGGAVSWMSSKQDMVADSTTEAKYIAACEAAKEGVWIRNFLYDLGIFPASVKPLDLYCDNSGAIAQAKESPQGQTHRSEISPDTKDRKEWLCRVMHNSHGCKCCRSVD